MNTATLPSSSSNASSPFPASSFCPQNFIPVLLVIPAFLIDLNTPNGVLDGFLYVSAVLACVWVPAANAALYTAFALILPMILGFVLSPKGIAIEIALINRCVAMGTIWLAAVAVWRNARSARARESKLAALHRELRNAQGAAFRERIALSDWLRHDISLELAIVEWRPNRLSHRTQSSDELQSEALVLRRAIQRTNATVHGKVTRLSDGV